MNETKEKANKQTINKTNKQTNKQIQHLKYEVHNDASTVTCRCGECRQDTTACQQTPTSPIALAVALCRKRTLQQPGSWLQVRRVKGTKATRQYSICENHSMSDL